MISIPQYTLNPDGSWNQIFFDPADYRPSIIRGGSILFRTVFNDKILTISYGVPRHISQIFMIVYNNLKSTIEYNQDDICVFCCSGFMEMIAYHFNRHKLGDIMLCLKCNEELKKIVVNSKPEGQKSLYFTQVINNSTNEYVVVFGDRYLADYFTKSIVKIDWKQYLYVQNYRIERLEKWLWMVCTVCHNVDQISYRNVCDRCIELSILIARVNVNRFWLLNEITHSTLNIDIINYIKLVFVSL